MMAFPVSLPPRRFAGALGAAALGLAACAVPTGPGSDRPVAAIDGMVIRNELPYPVYDVMLEVPATGGYAGCGMILQRSRCATSFPAAAYRREALVIRWTEHGEPHVIGDIVLDPPDHSDAVPAARLDVTIFASGQAGARLVSDPTR